MHIYFHIRMCAIAIVCDIKLMMMMVMMVMMLMMMIPARESAWHPRSISIYLFAGKARMLTHRF